MKIIVMTTGAFSLLSPSDWTTISRHRPHIAEGSDAFISTKLGDGHLVARGQVNDEATDEEMKKFWLESEKDNELAIAAFLSKYGAEPEQVGKGKRKPKPKPEDTTDGE